jgi:hypothetical protein
MTTEVAPPTISLIVSHVISLIPVFADGWKLSRLPAGMLVRGNNRAS